MIFDALYGGASLIIERCSLDNDIAHSTKLKIFAFTYSSNAKVMLETTKLSILLYRQIRTN